LSAFFVGLLPFEIAQVLAVAQAGLENAVFAFGMEGAVLQAIDEQIERADARRFVGRESGEDGEFTRSLGEKR
jgi:hypothetical protein